MRKATSGFTIVELLIVIVVIAILAAITIVAYNGIQDRAQRSSAQSAVRQVAGKASAYMAEHETCPANLSAIGVGDSGNTMYQYSCDTSANPAVYCVTAAVSDKIYYFDSAVQTKPAEGACSTYNHIASDDTENTKPVPNGTLDTSTFRTGTSSIRLGPGEVGRGIRNTPYSGTVGQKYTLSFWIRTASNWNGTSNNSKIRFGLATDGSLIAACSYEGVKTAWTFFSCTHTLNSTSANGFHITVSNDGNTGNIWLDDFILTKSY